MSDNALILADARVSAIRFSASPGPSGTPHLVLNRQPVAVPASPPLDPVAIHGSIPGDGILDGSSEDVAVVGKTRGEGRSVVERILGFISMR